MKKLTLLEIVAWHARKQINCAIWNANATKCEYSKWSPVDFTGWDAYAY